MNKYMFFFQKATYFQQFWFTGRCNCKWCVTLSFSRLRHSSAY